MTRSSCSVLLAAWLGISFSAQPAWGQNTPAQQQKPTTTSQPEEEQSPKSDDDLLRGPKVEDEPGERDPAFGMQERDRAQQRDMAGDQQLWIRAIQSLDLNENQQAELQSTLEQIRTSAREYVQTHREELNELRQKLIAARESGQPDPEAQRRMREFRANMPSLRTHREQILAILTPEQQQALPERIEAVREQSREARQRREATQPDEMAQRRIRFLRARQLKESGSDREQQPRETDRPRRRQTDRRPQ